MARRNGQISVVCRLATGLQICLSCKRYINDEIYGTNTWNYIIFKCVLMYLPFLALCAYICANSHGVSSFEELRRHQTAEELIEKAFLKPIG